ncbi:response regulator [Azospirillum halopraeferens]|uniref:response regulator n=1 Tax=Azospirillum halopraeferens TaxID=34010 RepID=UPI00040B1F6F|nr:response regulator [Azospirillum halopraeferens]
MATLDADPDDQSLLFADEEEEDGSAEDAAHAVPWTILIVDDEPEVHAITTVVLGTVRFEGRPLDFLGARSAAEARDLLRSHTDIAVVLLDVVMETDDAGLRLVRFIREELGNHRVRIILRTGQPGQAPERRVILGYDINDYKAKSELTAQTLFTATVAALRSYQHITTIDRSRRGLEHIVDAAATLFGERTLDRFADGVVRWIGPLLHGARGTVLCAPPADGGGLTVLAGSGVYAGGAGRPAGALVPPEILEDVHAALTGPANIHRPHHSVAAFRSRNHPAGVIVIDGHPPPSDLDRRLVELFCAKMAVGFDNVFLYDQLLNAQRATVHALGKLAEFKDEVTGSHVRRIERWSTLIAAELNARGTCPEAADPVFVERIGLASMLHDVGKVAVPDHILRKPGRLDPGEMSTMREHAAIGGRILRESAAMVAGDSYLTLGSAIAECHHEKWDGSGYPRGVKGDAIPLAARIVAVADVYDALLHRRPYKEAWEQATVIDLIRRESGAHFDPRVVEAFLAVLEREGAAPAA